MVLYTIINPADVLLYKDKEENQPANDPGICITDPYFFLEKDEFSKNLQKPNQRC
jgi:hypothetical protein